MSEFWKHVQRTAAKVSKWPAWKRGGPPPRNNQEVARRMVERHRKSLEKLALVD